MDIAQRREFDEWFVEASLKDAELETSFHALCQRLVEIGVSLMRGHLAMGSLHPMVASTDMTWWKDGTVSRSTHGYTEAMNEQWMRSPLRMALENQLPEFRVTLGGNAEWEQYPVLVELAEVGATDYLIRLFSFTDPERAVFSNDGAMISWTSNRPGGFSEADLECLEFAGQRIAVLAKIAKREQTLVGLVSAYLGSEAGRRVLNGQIRRGDLETIPAVIWYSDLRESTALAERLSPEAFVATLNDYFESTAGAVLDHGGEVLRFIGDAVLAIFPVSGVEGAERWARVALASAESAKARLVTMNQRRAQAGQPELGFGLGLHLGDVQFGNIGVAERVEFSVVGPAANKVCRIEGLTKALDETILVSREFSSLLPVDWRDLGAHQLQGIGTPERLFAPPT
ncbi:MAG: adenylate/guanylate cyclase domain-containing protein [Pseudomonadota bacterium]